MPGTRPRRRSIRPESQPISTSPTGMDFEKRRLIITQVAGSTILGIISSISNAIVVYDGVVISYGGDVVYKL